MAQDPEHITATIEQRAAFLSSLPAQADELDSEMLAHFSSRKNLIKASERTLRHWSPTTAGSAVSPDDLQETVVVTDITPELLQGEEWKTAEFRAFDVSLEAATPRTGRSHPMQALIERIRSIFLEMGFSELVDDYVQSAGWNMDALFIPQDHPAREMQDTFYLDEPASIDLDEEVMQAWKAIHEHGGATGSTRMGWLVFDGGVSTAAPADAYHREHDPIPCGAPTEACRVFSVDRVFRKEAIDRTHLPEFHQIEGIIMEEGANLQMLVTTLKTFYAKMGYPEVRVRPAYFPYTEPSLEIEVKWRGKWLELGGAGIFRPEVTEPLGITSPVLAWGMGLERLAMLVLDLDDIRQLYISDLDWLRKQPVL